MSLVNCCRLCLKNVAGVLLQRDGIFSLTREPELKHIILECFQIMVSDDEIVTKVCGKCYDQIRFVDKIRKRVQSADEKVKRFYASMNVKRDIEFMEDITNEIDSNDEMKIEAIDEMEIPRDDRIELNQKNIDECYQQCAISTNFEFDDTIGNDAPFCQYEFIAVEELSCLDHCTSEEEITDSKTATFKKPLPKAIKKIDCTCYICETEFDSIELLDIHLPSHIGAGQQKCNICQLSLLTVHSLNMHLRRTHFRKGKRVPCDECKKNGTVREFSSNFTLQAHIRTVHEGIVKIPEKNFVCPYCGKTFSTITLLRKHENIHTKAILHKCKHCPFSTASRSNLLRHERIHTAEKPFKCDECDASFIQKNAFHYHKANRHSQNLNQGTVRKVRRSISTKIEESDIPILERQLKCNFCPAVYYKERFYCQHIVEKHPTEKIPMIPCELCIEANKNVFFLTEREKQHHIGYHKKYSKMKVKERICSDCEEVFPNSESLHRHRQKHLKYDCNKCGKIFSSRKTLRLHLLTVHMKSKPYKCDTCDSSFGQLTSLNSHMKIHLKASNK